MTHCIIKILRQKAHELADILEHPQNSDLSLANMAATLKGLAMSETNSTAPTSLHQLQLSTTLTYHHLRVHTSSYHTTYRMSGPAPLIFWSLWKILSRQLMMPAVLAVSFSFSTSSLSWTRPLGSPTLPVAPPTYHKTMRKRCRDDG